MLTTNNVVRQKVPYEKVCDCKTNGNILFPREDANGTMYVLSNVGEIYSFYEGSSEQIYNIQNQQFSSLCFDNVGGMFVGELSNGVVFYKNNNVDNSHTLENILIKEFEDLPLRGPNALAFNKDENELYVCDAGNMMNCSLFPKFGSLYAIDIDSKIMRPILHSCLSYPADVLYDSSTGCIYLAELFANRVIRLKQSSEGIFHPSIFCQFSGRLGPSALAMDEFGNLYVARYEFQNLAAENDGLISVLNSEGVLIGELILTKLPEITGMLITPRKKETLFLTEKYTNGVIKIKLSHFISELDKTKLEEHLKF